MKGAQGNVVTAFERAVRDDHSVVIEWTCEWCDGSGVAAEIVGNQPEKCRLMRCRFHGRRWHAPILQDANTHENFC